MRSCYGVTTWGFAMSKDKRVGDLGREGPRSSSLCKADGRRRLECPAPTETSRGGRTASRSTSRSDSGLPGTRWCNRLRRPYLDRRRHRYPSRRAEGHWLDGDREREETMNALSGVAKPARSSSVAPRRSTQTQSSRGPRIVDCGSDAELRSAFACGIPWLKLLVAVSPLRDHPRSGERPTMDAS